MWSKITNQSEPRSTVAVALEALVAIGTAMLASLFVVAAVVPQVGSALIG